ncbi:enoyl-CoA hydratase [Luteitalea sp. TBR-22]|uniref:enoyl-CoA hydratase-related protein n=1 Tax=Luteitalea sp. TBR-22 TaxID=2802971 RepID=UPI001AF27E40|nr:enoyl-CoA hydratase-related protein [Luteitalea sp. TBR-22]BCS33995.1 enoyl-CoA hydratase [Luteitalea sp. TBR-22]
MDGLQVERRGDEVWLTLDRPEVRNALDDRLIAALRDAARALSSEASVRAVVIAGRGPAFCAGADLAWMQRMREHDEVRNLDDAMVVAEMFHAVASLPMPVIARVHGPALGGGAGLLAASDLVLAADDTVVGFTEARVGILPATIAPYVIRRVGLAAARRLFLRAHRLGAAEAHATGLIDEICPAATLDDLVRARLDELALGAPSAHRATKALLAQLAPLPDAATRQRTAEAIARQRVSDEGQEGLRAFLERRQPSWQERPEGDA